MKNLKTVFIPLMAIAMLFSGCAKSNSDFAERYKNRMGANPVDAGKTEAAGRNADANGLHADVVDIQRHWTDANQPGPRFVSAVILVNSQQTTVTATHFGTEISQGYVDVNGYKVVFHSMCGNDQCDAYYIALEVYRDQKMIIQEGIRKYFNPTNTDQTDIYQWFQPGESLPLLGADMLDLKGMVGYLNQGAVDMSSEILL